MACWLFVGARKGMGRRIAGSRWSDLAKTREASVNFLVSWRFVSWTIRVCIVVY
jgi:hypothetical protein